MKNVLITTVFLLLAQVALGQKVTVESSTEEMDTAKFSGLKKSYNRIIMAEREELTLFKIELLGPLLYAITDVDSIEFDVLHVSVERKFKPEWSWNGAFTMRLGDIEDNEYVTSGAVRYYFNMEKRISKGKSANNFSANYISSRVAHRATPGDGKAALSIDFLFGIQRRLWKYGYFDFDVGLQNTFLATKNNDKGVNLLLDFKLGIAF
ncbi:MAG: hypothetical protein AAFQ94_19020 [Bacteroidota bacterium]